MSSNLNGKPGGKNEPSHVTVTDKVNMTSGEEQKVCGLCGKVAEEKYCGACKIVYYCSVEHQKEDWKKHKLSCRPFTIERNDEIGSHWIATRNLPAGMILLDESPAFYGPRWTENNFEGSPNCLTCGVYMCSPELKTNRCLLCNWPVCSLQCSQYPVHARNECRIFSHRKIPFPPPEPHRSTHPSVICDCVTLIRGMGLKTDNLKVYKSVVNLQHFFVLPQNNKKLEKLIDIFVNRLTNLIGELDHPVEEYKKLAGLKKINAFAGPAEQPPQNECTTFGNMSRTDTGSHVYALGCLVNHSCIPNCTWSISSFPNLRMRIRTTVPVSKGEQLTHSYNHTAAEQGTFRRQLSIRTGFGFICKCRRCLDPTELNTFTSAVACQEPGCLQHSGILGNGSLEGNTKNVGYYLPTDPLNLDSAALHECNRCHVQVTAGQLKQLAPVDRLASQMRNYAESVCGALRSQGERKRDEEFYENFIKLYGPGGSAKFQLHPNHWILQKATMLILGGHMTLDNFTGRPELERWIGLYEYLLRIQDRICPGLSSQRALTLRNLALMILTLLANFSSVMLDTVTQRWAEFCKRAQREALEFYETEVKPGEAKLMVIKLREEIEFLSQNLPLIST